MRAQYIKLCFVEIGKMKRRIACSLVKNEENVNAIIM